MQQYYGYIYHIINTKNGKHYIGKTFDIKDRVYDHFHDLEKQRHHSHKLLRAFNIYGQDYFIVEYKLVAINSEEDLSLAEMQEIEVYDSYKNGYNETLGGDGHKLSIGLSDSVLVYNICLNYGGVHRLIARYFNCDHSVVDGLAKKDIFKNLEYNEEQYNELIKKIGIKEENRVENYVPHNDRKLSEELCLELLSIIMRLEKYDKTMCEIFNVTSKLTWRLKKGLIYKEYLDKYNQMSNEEQKQLMLKTFNKYKVKLVYANRQRRCVKDALTQELIDYILDNKNKLSMAKTGRDLGISADRVRSVCRGISYKDLVENYYSSRK